MFAASRGGKWNEIEGKPNTYPPSSHTHSKSEVGLGSVDNTADANKRVSYAASAGNADTLDGYHASAFAPAINAWNVRTFTTPSASPGWYRILRRSGSTGPFDADGKSIGEVYIQATGYSHVNPSPIHFEFAKVYQLGFYASCIFQGGAADGLISKVEKDLLLWPKVRFATHSLPYYDAVDVYANFSINNSNGSNGWYCSFRVPGGLPDVWEKPEIVKVADSVAGETYRIVTFKDASLSS